MTLTRRFLGLALIGLAAACQRSAPDAFERGVAYYREEKFAKASGCFEQALATATPTAQAWNFLGVCHLHADKTNEAIVAFEAALKLDPVHSAARYNLGVALLEAGQHEQALPHLRQLTQLGQPLPSAYYQLGRACLRAGAWAAAKQAFEKLSDADANADIQNSLGIIEVRLGNFKRAKAHFEAAVKLQPDLAAAHLNTAVLEHHYLGQKAAAAQHYQKFLELLPESPQRETIRLEIAKLTGETERLAQLPAVKPVEPPAPPTPAPAPAPLTSTPIPVVEKPAAKPVVATPTPPPLPPAPIAVTPPALVPAPAPPPPPVVKRRTPISVSTLRPGNRTAAVPFFNDGINQQRQGKLPAAIAAYSKAVSLDPAYAQAYYNLAIAQATARQLDKALDNYELALVADPKFNDARYNYAIALQQAGFLVDALAQYEKILEKSPKDASIHFTLAALYARDPQAKAKTREHYQAFLRLAPSAPGSRDARDWLQKNP